MEHEMTHVGRYWCYFDRGALRAICGRSPRDEGGATSLRTGRTQCPDCARKWSEARTIIAQGCLAQWAKSQISYQGLIVDGAIVASRHPDFGAVVDAAPWTPTQMGAYCSRAISRELAQTLARACPCPRGALAGVSERIA